MAIQNIHKKSDIFLEQLKYVVDKICERAFLCIFSIQSDKPIGAVSYRAYLMSLFEYYAQLCKK